MRLVYVSFMLLCNVIFTVSAKRNIQYTWRSWLIKDTGIASSRETSVVVEPTKSFSKPFALQPMTEELVKSYPKWLCSGPVTFGFLQAVSLPKHGYLIRVRLLNLTLFSFGAVQSVSHRRDKQPSMETITCTYTMPMTGGLLSLAPPRGSNDRGSLLFTFRQDQTMNSSDIHCDSLNADGCHLSLRTALLDYRPWLAGTAPIHPWRRRTYLSSQSLVHAFVMWRYHKHVWKQICQ